MDGVVGLAIIGAGRLVGSQPLGMDGSFLGGHVTSNDCICDI